MMPAVKHGDPQLGVDIHLCVVPPSPSPVPLPTPHMSVVFDPMDYLPFIGATVTVCGMKRGVAGTAGTAVHIPPGFPFAPKLPDKDDEIFMGSATVVADGDPFSFLGVPVLACQVAGMPSPPRPRRKGGPRVMMLPTVFNLAIPTNVFVGGPPTISLMGMAFKLGFAGLGRLAKSRFAKAVGARFRAWRKAKFGHLKPSFLKCKILRAEPVNIVTGAVSVEQEDFTLPGMIPVSWTRRYASDNPRPGACGVGWETPADARLEHDQVSGVVLFHHPLGDIAIFPAAPQEPGAAGAVLELMDGAVLSDEGKDFQIRTKEDRIYRFQKSHAAVAADGSREYPLGVIEDLCGNTLFYERDAQRRVVAIRERAGRRIEIERGTAGFIRQVSLHVPETGFRHVFVEYEQDQAGDLTEVRDALGQPYRFAYDAHHMVQHTDRNGLSFYYEYDKAAGDWRVVRSWGDGGLHAYKFAYLDAAQERRITDSLGHVSVVTLDERGLPISEIDPLGGKTVFEYDAAGRTTAVVDQDGLRTEYAFDDHGNLTRLVRADGSAIEIAYGPYGAERITDPNANVWKRHFDARGLLVRQETPGGLATTSEHDSRGRLIAVTEPDGVRRGLWHDDSGRIAGLADGNGEIASFEHDPFGNLLVVEDHAGRRTEHVRDAKGRLVRGRLAGGGTVTFSYDAQDNVTRQVDPDGAETGFEYAGTGVLRRRMRPDASVVEYTYDTEERLVSVRTSPGTAHVFERDALGRIVAETDPGGGTRRFVLSPAGRLREIRDEMGRTIHLETDGLGRTLKRRLVDPGRPAENKVENYAYDGFGNLLACANGTTRIERAYDADNRLIRECQGDEFLLLHDFGGGPDERSRTVRLALGDQVVQSDIRFGANAPGTVAGIVVEGAGQIEIRRDNLGRTDQESFGHGLRRFHRYDAEGRPVEQRVEMDGREVLRQRFAYSPGGRLVAKTDSSFGEERYGHDNAGRLASYRTAAGASALFEYAGTGSRLVREGARATVAGASLEYILDDCGAVVERRTPNGNQDLVWDGFGRLMESRDAVGGFVRYRYDALGRRVAKEGPHCTTRFVWHGDALVGEIVQSSQGQDPPAAQFRHWIHRPDTFVPLAVVEWSTEAPAEAGKRTARLLFHHTDPNGFPTRLLDAAGAVAWSARVGPWGAGVDVTSTTADNAIRLQNQYCDAETGLHYNRHRYYDPEAGVFISRDPIGLLGGSDLYAYAPNIFDWIDPLGLQKTCTVYRLEGARNQRIFADASGNVSIPDKDKFLHISLGDDSHAQYFLAKKRAQYPNSEIKAFDVPEEVAEDIRARAVPQREASRNKGAPQIDDKRVSKDLGRDPRDALGVTGDDIAKLEESAIPGSLRTVPAR
jgi:RHS repeat-associated protein